MNLVTGQQNLKQLRVATHPGYNVHIGIDIAFSDVLLNEISLLTDKNIKDYVIIVDKNISHNYKTLADFIYAHIPIGVKIQTLEIDISESRKTRETKQEVEDQLFELGSDRNTCLIAIGGGVLLDLVGFVAATFMRGIPVIYIATTLLAMVDAAVGGKTAVNTQYGKNLVGAFKQPDTVIIDLTCLKTLPELDYLSAIAEVIKLAIILDEELFDFLVSNKSSILSRDLNILSELIYISVNLKKQIVEQDEKESNLRQLLNFGHTFGHAIEKQQNYSLRHGFAVALGLWLESSLAYNLGILSGEDSFKIIDLLESFYKNKIYLLEQNIDIDNIYELLIYDKKTKNKQPYFVLVNKIAGYVNDDNQCAHIVDKDIVMSTLQGFDNITLIK